VQLTIASIPTTDDLSPSKTPKTLKNKSFSALLFSCRSSLFSSLALNIHHTYPEFQYPYTC
jgi:hypothetical protein